MARIEALSLLNTEDGKAYLAEEYGKVIDNIQTGSLSQSLKNKDLSGDPTTGTVTAKRFANAEIADYGTARAGGAGKKIKELEVVIAIDDDKEFIEEAEEKDTKLYGVDGLITKRAANHGDRAEKYLEKRFWSVTATEGTAFTPSSASAKALKVIGEIISTIHKTKNEFVDGVPVDLIHIVCNSDTFAEVRDDIDLLPAASITTAEAEVGKHHGAFVHDSTDLPDGVKAIGYVEGATAQPVLPDIAEPGKIPFSKAYAFGLFLSGGAKCVAPDLVQVWGTPVVEDEGDDEGDDD